MKGQLYIVATPIGNLDDMSFRAVEILKSVAIIAAEDTRHSAKLLQNFGIKTPLMALHEHNESSRSDQLVAKLIAGNDIALISDAGTPLISDPGFRIVTCAQDAGIKVVSIPGACAAIAALSVSGLPTDRFYFEGFLPAKSAARKHRINELSGLSSTVIYYESCHRILACLQDMQAVLGLEREVCIAKELTKRFECVKRGVLPELIEWLESDDKLQQGEFVVLVKAVSSTQPDRIHAERLLVKLMAHLPLKTAASVASDLCSMNKNELYNLGLSLKSK